MCIRWFSRNRLNARLSKSKESRRTRKEKRRTRTDKRSHFHLVMAQGFNKAPYSITQNFRGFQGKDGIQWNNDKNQHSVANIRFIADFVCPKTRLKRMPYGSCHFSNLREQALALNRCHFLQSHSTWFFETLRQYIVKCHLDDKKNFACDMYVAYVMCLFVLHATADICAMTQQLGFILRTLLTASEC